MEEKEIGIWKRLKNSEIAKRIKGIKNLQIILLIFIIAVALVIYSSVTASKENRQSVTASEEEEKLASILSSVDGAGTVEIMITKSNGEIAGVLVVADGAVNPLVRLRLVDATAGALGVDKRVVSVFSRNN